MVWGGYNNVKKLRVEGWRRRRKGQKIQQYNTMYPNNPKATRILSPLTTELQASMKKDGTGYAKADTNG